jgi:hypothetical protein
MGNAYLPRETVHEWSKTIGAKPAEQVSLMRLLRTQRRLGRFLEENAGQIHHHTRRRGFKLTGVIVRLFELAGGRMRTASWTQIRDAETRIQEAVGSLLPLDKELPSRARAVTWRAQPHILDEALMALFESEELSEGEEDLPLVESLKVYLALWVATEVLDGNWTPPNGFEGLTTYAHVPIDPKDRKAAG